MPQRHACCSSAPGARTPLPCAAAPPQQPACRRHPPPAGQPANTSKVPLLPAQRPEQRPGASQQLLAALQAAADQSGPAAPSALFQLQCSAAGGPQLEGQLLLPDALISLTPLYSKRLAALPFAEVLQRPLPAGSVDTGYLTMDQARSLVPLRASDSLVSRRPGWRPLLACAAGCVRQPRRGC
jgi:hypothetical protein